MMVAVLLTGAYPGFTYLYSVAVLTGAPALTFCCGVPKYLSLVGWGSQAAGLLGFCSVCMATVGVELSTDPVEGRHWNRDSASLVTSYSSTSFSFLYQVVSVCIFRF